MCRRGFTDLQTSRGTSSGSYHRASVFDEAVLAKATLTSNGVNVYGMGNVPGYDAATSPVLKKLWEQTPSTRLALRLLGVNYVVLPVVDPRRAHPRDGFTEMMDPMPGARLYRVNEPLPRVYALGRTGRTMSGPVTLSHLLDEDVVSGKSAWLEPSPYEEPASDETTGAATAEQMAGYQLGAGKAGDCEITRFESGKVDINCDMRKDGWLVLNEQSAPGWRVTVDEEPARMFAANTLARAVPLEAGLHSVTFDYKLPGLRLGGYLTMFALIAVVGAGLLPLLPARVQGISPEIKSPEQHRRGLRPPGT